MRTPRRTPVPLALAFGAAAAALVGASGHAAATQIHGLLRIPDALTHPAKHSVEPPLRPYWSEWNGLVDPQPAPPNLARDFAVVLLGTGPKEPVGCSYALRDGDLDPKTMVAKQGTTLRITNEDPCTHQLYSEGIDGFSALDTRPGNARTVPLAKAGHFVVLDRLYAHVKGDLRVVPDLAACAALGDDGHYRFGDVPAGTYTLKVFHGEKELLSQPLRVPQVHGIAVDPIDVPAKGE